MSNTSGPSVRELVGPFLILGVDKDADEATIDAHWAERVLWCRKGTTKLSLEDVHWAREVLRDPNAGPKRMRPASTPTWHPAKFGVWHACITLTALPRVGNPSIRSRRSSCLPRRNPIRKRLPLNFRLPTCRSNCRRHPVGSNISPPPPSTPGALNSG